jgi:hypothetical protein
MDIRTADQRNVNLDISLSQDSARSEAMNQSLPLYIPFTISNLKNLFSSAGSVLNLTQSHQPIKWRQTRLIEERAAEYEIGK